MLLAPFTPANALTLPLCPEGANNAEGDEPQLRHKVQGGFLILCGKKDNSFSRDVYSGFNLFIAPTEKKPIKLPLEGADVDDYGVIRTPNGITLQEMALIDNDWLPLFQRNVICSKGACKVGRRRCANAKLQRKPKSAKALIKAYSSETAQQKSTGQATDPAEIAVLLAAALGGEKESIEAFEKNPGFRLDGAATEHYEHGRKLLRQLKAMKCRL